MAKSGYAISQYQIQRFAIQRCTIHALIVILCMPWIEWFDRKQPISHQKRRWIVRIGFDSFHLQQKATKIKPTFFPPMQILLRSPSDLTCIENRFMQFAFKLVVCIVLSYSKKYINEVSHDVHTFVHVVSEAVARWYFKIWYSNSQERGELS